MTVEMLYVVGVGKNDGFEFIIPVSSIHHIAHDLGNRQATIFLQGQEEEFITIELKTFNAISKFAK